MSIGNKIFDCIVVGAGIEGLATAAKLASLQKTVLVLEQFPLFHTRGSSSGLTRITRLAYKKHEYVNLVKASLPQWKSLEKEFGSKLYRETGVLTMCRADQIVSYENSMKQSNVPFRCLSKAELERKFGSLFNIPDGYTGFFEPEGGLLYSSRCLRAYMQRLTSHGDDRVVIKDNCAITDIITGDILTLITNDEVKMRCKSVVLTMGPWTPKFLQQKLNLSVPVSVDRTFLCYWKENHKGQYSADNGVPVVLFSEPDGHTYFMKPTDECPGLLQFGLHIGYPCDPDTPADIDSQDYLSKSKNFAQKFRMNVQTSAPAVIDPCFYQESADTDYILDVHPMHKNIVYGTGFSGHGFKLAPIIGEILAFLSQGLKSEYYCDRFALKRFEKHGPHAKL